MHHKKLETLTRLGFAARGVMYILIGFLALTTGSAKDGAGALDYLSSSGGKLLLGLMAAGFAAYGLWRLVDAFFDTEGNGSDTKGTALRIGAAASGFIHFGFAYYAARLASGEGGQSGSDSTQQGAATALSFPGGQTLVALAAVALFVVGAFQFVKAANGSFLQQMDPNATNKAWVRILGQLGHASRGAVFLIMSYFLGRAALHERAREAGGMGEALSSLPSTVQLIVAFGLLLFGLFSLIEARYRIIQDPGQTLEKHGLPGMR